MRKLFGLTAGILVYTWLGYPAMLWLASFSRRGSHHTSAAESWPSVTILITVHNGAKVIEKKLENTFALEYAPQLLQILVTSDGSTDGTDEIVRCYAQKGVELVPIMPQRGKTAAQNAALAKCRGDVIVFSNVQTMLRPDCLKLLLSHFAAAHVGGVAPRLVWDNLDASVIAQSGSLYWKYEQFLWQQESQIGLLAWAPGACMAVRRKLVEPMPEIYGEDVILPLWVVGRGYRFVYEPAAVASQPRASTARAEYTSRVRMTQRSFGATLHAWPLTYIGKFPALTWAIFSHKLLRWLTPYFMAAAFLSNVTLLRHRLYQVTGAAQVVFYLMATIGWATKGRNVAIPGIGAAYSFCLINVAFAVGVWRALRGQQIRIFRSEE